MEIVRRAWEAFARHNVIALVVMSARGKQSGVPVQQRRWHVWTLRHDKLWRLRMYATEAEAFESVGPAR